MKPDVKIIVADDLNNLDIFPKYAKISIKKQNGVTVVNTTQCHHYGATRYHPNTSRDEIARQRLQRKLREQQQIMVVNFLCLIVDVE